MQIKTLNINKPNEWSDNWADDSVFNRSVKDYKEFKQNGLNVLADIKSESCVKQQFSILKKSISNWVDVVLTAKQSIAK